jgi:glycosyltransferase involved in cell wall biosynthesis
VGEYSRLHNSLQEGLQHLGHEVTLISTGDYFKDYPSDIKLIRYYESGILKKIKIALYVLFKWDITSNKIKKQFFSNTERLKGFDIVQLINESPFGAAPKDEMEMISFLKKHNKKLVLLSCGTDFISVTHALSDEHPYSILSFYKDKSIPSDTFKYILKYVRPPFKKLHQHVFQLIDGVISSDIDYHIPLKNHPKYLGLIPNPINISSLDFIALTATSPIVIFMGVNRFNAHTKGIIYFEKALEKLKKKFGSAIRIVIAENLPYAEYIEKYNTAHIVLDQVFAYDQGYNALEAMAKGKVVFTGAEKAFEEHYQLKNPVAINALPDVEYLVKELSKLIKNPKQISVIGAAARDFVVKHHEYVTVARQYIETWRM